jgi:hypothetical protein
MTSNSQFLTIWTISMTSVLVAFWFIRPRRQRNERKHSPTPFLSEHFRWFNKVSPVVRAQFESAP